MGRALVLYFLCAVTMAHGADDARVDALLARMTLPEKLGQLTQLEGRPGRGDPDEQRTLVRAGGAGSFLNVRGAERVNALQRVAVEESRLKIPLLFGFDVVHGHRTVFPVPLAQAATWDPAAAERAARVAAREASADGVRWTFAPMVDIARDPRWGRIVEGAGEDPYLGAAMARAQVRGFQGADLAAPDAVAACVKHFAAYGAPAGGRDYDEVDVSEGTLREVYLPPYRAAVDAGAATAMSAFHALNGVPCTANDFLLGQVLRGEWGFPGFVVSDYNAVAELIAHGVAAGEPEAARAALAAGVDMEMATRLYLTRGPELVRTGALDPALVDAAVRRVLRVKFALGLFEHPYADPARAVTAPEHRRAAREVAARSLVLLENRGVLPLPPTLKSLALIGPLADDARSMLGPWKADGKPEEAVTLLAGLRERLPAVRLVHAHGCDVEGGADGIAEAVRAAQDCDVAVLALGEDAGMSGEAEVRADLGLPGRQQQLLEAVVAAGRPVVVVLFSGRPLAVPWMAAHVPAILAAWFPGSEGGRAIADVLVGDVNPGGKLPVTVPRAVGQVPIYYARRSSGRPPDPAHPNPAAYLDLPGTPLWPFGHGLSYTQFGFADLAVEPHRIAPGGSVRVTVQVKNAGARGGEEVVQLYLRARVASRARPVRELRGFSRVALAPGEARTVEFHLGPAELGGIDAAGRFAVEPGPFEVFAGGDSTAALAASFEVTAASPPTPTPSPPAPPGSAR